MARFAWAASRCKGDALLFSYILVYPSAPSGTLTMLRLASPAFSKKFYKMFRNNLGRVTGGVYALQGQFQWDALFATYC